MPSGLPLPLLLLSAPPARPIQALGNEAFKAGDYEKAVGHFTDAIAADPTDHVFYSNRSASLASLRRYEEALADGRKCVELKPEWAKGYSRMGAAAVGLRDFAAAEAAYKEGLEKDPGSDLLKSGLAEAEAAARQAGGAGANPMAAMFSDPNLMARLAVAPETRNFMSQPDFLQMIAAIQKDPNRINEYVGDQRMMAVLSVLLGMNVQGAGPAGAAAGANGAPPAPTPEAAPAPVPTQASAPEPEPELSAEEQEAKANKARAQEEKQAGNAAYKKKDFEEAIRRYNAAIELDSTDISFLSNRAAVYLEMGRFSDCAEDCDSAVKVGRELRADYKLIAKAMTRKGTALAKQGDLEQAITQFQKSLTEHRNPDTLKKLNDAERALKQLREASYIDADKCAEAKEKGNAFFKEGKYPEAVEQYSEAIKRGPPKSNPECHKLYSNRAACYTKLTAMNEAKKDAEKCIELEPQWAKGYSRKATVQFFMKEYDKAMETYKEGLAQDPESQELKDGLARCVQKIQMGNAGMLSEEEQQQRREHAMADPEIQQILTDPVIRQVLQDFQENPKAAQEHLKAPTVMAKIQKLVNAGIVQMR